jgi:hypothetical protein
MGKQIAPNLLKSRKKQTKSITDGHAAGQLQHGEFGTFSGNIRKIEASTAKNRPE